MPIRSANIRNTNTIRYVMKNGRLYEGETLNEIWPRQRALPDAAVAERRSRGQHFDSVVNDMSYQLPAASYQRACDRHRLRPAASVPSGAAAQGLRPERPVPAPPKKPLPLEAARKAEFTATKGTWISLDVSPDGQTIVFDLLGDLYTLPIAGGKATRITSGMAYDAQPRFSPDGKKIVFVSDRTGGDNLWTMTLDGKDTTQVTQGNGNLYVSPEWVPDGKYVVASRAGGLGGAAKIYMYHVRRRQRAASSSDAARRA